MEKPTRGGQQYSRTGSLRRVSRTDTRTAVRSDTKLIAYFIRQAAWIAEEEAVFIATVHAGETGLVAVENRQWRDILAWKRSAGLLLLALRALVAPSLTFNLFFFFRLGGALSLPNPTPLPACQTSARPNLREATGMSVFT